MQQLHANRLLRHGFIEHKSRKSINVAMLFGDARGRAIILHAEVQCATLCVGKGNNVFYDLIVGLRARKLAFELNRQ